MMTHKQIKLLGLTGAICACASLGQAQNYYLAGGALTPAWTPNANQMSGGPSVFTLTVATTTNTFNECKVTDGTWDNTWPGSNLKINGDANGSNTFYFYPGTIGDGWFPLANRVGYENPGDEWGISGDFTSPAWADDPTAKMSTNSSGVFVVNYVVPSVGSHEFKFKIVGTWDGAVGQDFGSAAANIGFSTVAPNQSIEFDFDPVKGRYFVNIPPVTNQVTFAVDMSAQIALGNFNPVADSVFVSGTFNGWPGTGAGAVVLTNYPAYNGGSNTNIYYATATNILIGLPGSFGSEYKFTSSAPAYSGSGGYEPLSSNRSFNLLTTNGVLVLPVVLFGNTYVSDYLTADTTVYFTVNMTNATTTDGHVFDPSTDTVVINGNFVAGGWAAWDPISLASQVMMNDPVGSEIYTYSATIPAGALIGVDYKYGVIYPGQTNSVDNEAAAYQDHYRYVRATATGSYTNSLDTFGNQYVEPSFGQLTSTSTGTGQVTVSWLGRPGVELQTSADLAGGIWQTNLETDGTNWTTGYNTINNGFMSQTNLPAVGGQQFFRLIQSW